MDAEELFLVRSSFEAALAGTPGNEFLAVLAKLGWHELREAEPAVAVAELFEAQGRSLAATPALDLVVAGALGVELPDDAAVAHPTLAGWDAPPGSVDENESVHVDGLILSGRRRAGVVLVPCRAPDGRLRLAEAGTDVLQCIRVTGFDEHLQLVRVTGRVPVAEIPVEIPWATAAAAARRALGHELIGLAQRMLDDACRHVVDREQFGRPISMFQAVRHRLAELHVAVMSARSVLDAAWTVNDPAQATLAADAAKALAGRAALLAGRHCLQVTGAIGFTWEHELHRRIRRAHLVDGLYGPRRRAGSRHRRRADGNAYGPPDRAHGAVVEPGGRRGNNGTVTSRHPGAWPFVGREELLDHVRRVLERGPATGVVLVGPAGAGKTRTAFECLALAERAGLETAHVTAASATASLPLGAFATMLPPNLEASDRTALLRIAEDAIATRSGTRRLALLIDDAQLLDEVSTALTYHLAWSGRVFLIVTVRTGGACPNRSSPCGRTLWSNGCRWPR